MVPIHIRARVGEDGSLVFKAPSAYQGHEVEAFLVLQTLSSTTPPFQDNNGWPADFFEKTAGKWQGELERPDQGIYEERDALP